MHLNYCTTKIVLEKIPALSDSKSKKEEGKNRYH